MTDKYNGNYPKAWSPAEIETYLESEREPSKSSNGLWVTDPEREAKELKDWSLAELYALASGQLFSFYATGTDDFYQAVRGKAVLDDRDATKWGEEDLDNWLLFEKTPEKSPNGYYVNDPDRWVKDADKWNDTELADLGAGYFGEPERNQLYILDEASERFGLPLGITWEDFCAYITTKTQPALTSNGLLVNDRNRRTKAIEDWTEGEVEAWLLDEIVIDNERLDKRVLVRAIQLFSVGRYWTKDQVKDYVIRDVYPEINYKQYSDEQLTVLAEQDNDKEAQHELLSRHPAFDPPKEEEDEPAPVPPVEELPDDSGGEEEPGPDPEEPEPIEEPREPEAGQDVPSDEDHSPETPEPDVEEPPALLWTDLVPEGSAVYEALVAGTSDVVINDTDRRRLLSASKWTLEELVGWARGYIPHSLNTTDETLVTALRVALGAFVTNWSDSAVVAFVELQELPEGIQTGVLVEDCIRDKMHPGDWRDEEMRAWADGKVITTVAADRILLAARNRFKIPDRLNDEEAKEYIVTGIMPDDTIPPIEAGKPVSKRQLDAWLKGELPAENAEEERLFTQARQQYGIDHHWTNAHLLAFIRNGSQPKRLSDGTLVEDRMRCADVCAAWSWKELRALAAGEITADFTINDALERIRRLIDVQFGVSPAHWSDEDVINYLLTESKPRALESGVFINDPTRPLKQAIEWRDAEVKAWLRGEIEETAKAPVDALWDEVYLRFRVPLFWYREDAKSFVLTGKQVPATPSGIWIRDRNRDARPVKHWTRREIKAWCRGQIMPAISASPEVMIRRAADLFGVTTMLDDDSIKKRISSITEESMTMTVRFVTEDLRAYEEGRVKAGDSAAVAAPYQTMLDRCINRVMRLEGEDFVQGWTELLNFFHKNSNGIMSPKKIYTGVGQMSITPKGLRIFNNITSVLMQTADPATRDRQVKVIEWNASLKDVSNEKTRQNILSYYGQ
ncbi:hypothetical protein D3C76_345600 [compost metagenome]